MRRTLAWFRLPVVGVGPAGGSYLFGAHERDAGARTASQQPETAVPAKRQNLAAAGVDRSACPRSRRPRVGHVARAWPSTPGLPGWCRRGTGRLTAASEVFVAIALNEVPLDTLVLELTSSRNAIYQTLLDARPKLRAALAAKGLPRR